MGAIPPNGPFREVRTKPWRFLGTVQSQNCSPFSGCRIHGLRYKLSSMPMHFNFLDADEIAESALDAVK